MGILDVPRGAGGGKPTYAAAYLKPWQAGHTTAYTKTLTAPAAEFTASTSGTTMTISASASGSVAVGQYVYGGTLLLGTKVTAIGTYNGTSGTVTINQSQTVTSVAMCGTVPQTPTPTFYNCFDVTAFNMWGGAKCSANGTSGGYAINQTEISSSYWSLPFFIEFQYTGRYIEIAQRITTANSYSGLKVWTNGVQETQFAEQTTVGTNVINDVYHTLLDFGSAATRTITIAMDFGFVGIFGDAQPTFSTRQRNGKVMVAYGHSWGAGGNAGTGGSSTAGTVMDNFPIQLALMTGHDEVVILSEPGTGWYNDNASTQLMTAASTPYNSIRRLQSALEHKPSTLLMFGGVNDLAVAGYNTNVNIRVTQALNYILPNLNQYTNLFIAGSEYCNLYSAANHQAEDNQIATGIANCSAPSRVKQIICTSDNTVNGTPWLTGTGNTSAPAGDGGNSDTYLDSSKKHINRLGHQTLWAPNMSTRMTSLGV